MLGVIGIKQVEELFQDVPKNLKKEIEFFPPQSEIELKTTFNKLTDKRHQIDNRRTHCVLLAKDNEGYENLLKMTTIAHLEGYYYKPRVDWDLLKKHSKGLIALSACMQGDIPQAILNHDDDKIKELIEKFQSTLSE